MLKIEVHSVVFTFKTRLVFISEVLMTVVMSVSCLVLCLNLILAFKVSKIAALIVLVLMVLLHEGALFFICLIIVTLDDNTIHFRTLLVASLLEVPRRERLRRIIHRLLHSHRIDPSTEGACTSKDIVVWLECERR